MNQLSSKDDGYKSKEFNKICDELFQLKQLLNIRKKRYFGANTRRIIKIKR